MENSLKQSSYDEIPYESQPFAQSHPDRLATLGRFFGLSPAPVTQCRVLELGCASGGNLIPMAYHLQGASHSQSAPRSGEHGSGFKAAGSDS
jgi:hypothetical protein